MRLNQRAIEPDRCRVELLELEQCPPVADRQQADQAGSHGLVGEVGERGPVEIAGGLELAQHLVEKADIVGHDRIDLGVGELPGRGQQPQSNRKGLPIPVPVLIGQSQAVQGQLVGFACGVAIGADPVDDPLAEGDGRITLGSAAPIDEDGGLRLVAGGPIEQGGRGFRQLPPAGRDHHGGRVQVALAREEVPDSAADRTGPPPVGKGVRGADCPIENGQCGRYLAIAFVVPGKLKRELRRAARVAPVLALQCLAALLEQLFVGHRRAAGADEAEQERFERGGGGGSPLGFPSSFELAAGLEHLIDGHAGSGQQGGHGDDRGGRRHPVATEELPGPIGPRVRSRHHRLIGEEPAEVVGERGNRLIALLGPLLEGLGENRVEIPVVELPKPARGGGPDRRLLDGGVVERVRAGGDGVGEPERVGVDRGEEIGGRRFELASGGMSAAQQDVQHHAEGVDVGGGRDGFAEKQLGRGVLGREGAAALLGQGARSTKAAVVEQLGDPEVEQFDGAVGGHHHVRRFDVAMDDQVGVGAGHGIEHRQEQFDPRPWPEAAVVRVFVDPFALDVLEDEVGLADLGDPRIEQFADVGMVEPGQHGALEHEPLFGRAADQRQVEQLDRHLTLIATVVAAGQPDRAHATLAQRRLERVVADRLSGQPASPSAQERLDPGGARQLLAEPSFPCQQRLETIGHDRIIGPQGGKPGRQVSGRDFERLIEQWAEPGPEVGVDWFHGSSVSGRLFAGPSSRQVGRPPRTCRGRRRDRKLDGEGDRIR